MLIRWGDPVVAGAPAFDPRQQTAAAQRGQFGYNCDFIGYFPMPGAANPSHHGLLTVNLEYTNEELMFPGLRRQDVKGVMFAEMTAELVDIEMAAHGGAVIEVRRENGKWQVVGGSKYARRIDATTPMEITGPAAGSSAAADLGRSDRPPRARHDQQLRRRRDAVGHLAHLRGEFPRLLLRQAAGRPSARRAITRATACRPTGTPGASSTTAST